MDKKKWIAIGAAMAVVVVGGFTVSNVMAGDTALPIKTTPIYPMELVDSISIKGTVESMDKSNVYSTLGLSVKTVYVEVGDRVTEGQVLCEMNTEDLELSIAQQKAELDVSQQSNLNQLQNNRRLYAEAASNLSNGTQIKSAEASVRSAEVSLENAQRTYNDTLKDYMEGTNAQVTSAESSLTNAEIDLDTKKTTYEENKVLYEAGVITLEAYTQSETAYVNAQNRYKDAQTELENTKTSLTRSLEQSENALKSAQISYDNAKASREATSTAAAQDVEKAQSNVSSAQISTNTDAKTISIQKLEKQLVDATITSPIAGTVTAVYAKEGASGTGLLFVIEDTDRLKVETNIKEYDVVKIKTGMHVDIKTDSTGDALYEGRISKIDPTAVKDASGDTASASDVEFAAEVEVVSLRTELRVGMNARLNVILDKKENIYCVPYDAVARNEEEGDGSAIVQSVVYTVEEDGQGYGTAKAISVSTGMETDFYVEIISDALTDGVKIINDASMIHDGMRVAVN